MIEANSFLSSNIKKITPFETKIGIIGFGRIGKKLKEILDAIGFPNITYDPYIPECSGTLMDVLSFLSMTNQICRLVHQYPPQVQ